MASDRLSTKKEVDRQLIRKLQDRIADLAIGHSTLRNQGAKEVAPNARRLLRTIKLGRYRCKSRMGTQVIHLDLLYWRNSKRKSQSSSHRETTRKRASRR